LHCPNIAGFLPAFTIGASLISLPISAQTGQPQKGSASAVTDEPTIAMVTTRFQKDFRDLAIPATVSACKLMERISDGVRDSDTAYGAACTVSIANEKPKILLLCDDDYGEGFAMVRSSFVNSQEWMDAFVRKNCF
jgi:hypothetical protein